MHDNPTSELLQVVKFYGQFKQEGIPFILVKTVPTKQVKAIIY